MNSKPVGKSPQFTFVLEKGQAGIRSHAMRESWKQRHKTKRDKPSQGQAPRRLLPSTGPASATNASHSDILNTLTSVVEDQYTNNPPLSREQDLDSMRLDELELLAADLAEYERNEDDMAGLPFQALTGMNYALAGARVDPFDMCPVKLTSQHQKLLHHWLSTHATMMFEELPIKTFNPMKDVWFPLDLSNASSFNTIMAHSAAHLAYLQGAMDSLDALTYKTEAIRILNAWLTDPIRSLSDDAFAAVVRILTFERYWGTEGEWKIHRDGLQQMIEARGGLAALQNNWRVGLVVCLVSSMAKPSWFDSSNHIWEISDALNPTLSSIIDMHKIHCLWLVSFIQDMRTLMRSSSKLHQYGLGEFRGVHDAVLLLYFYFQRDAQTYANDEAGYATPEYDRLTCLFFISIVLQESMSSPYTFLPVLSTPGSSAMSSGNSLAMLDASLNGSRTLWEGSVRNLHLFLFDHLVNFPDGSLKTTYAMQMTAILKNLSIEARRGVEKCLLNMLCGTKGGRLRFPGEDSWTPDSLLSSMHGE
ncbi:hypothetical protein V1509DRAFT_563093 [Lipomyces kononenkoae]